MSLLVFLVFGDATWCIFLLRNNNESSCCFISIWRTLLLEKCRSWNFIRSQWLSHEHKKRNMIEKKRKSAHWKSDWIERPLDGVVAVVAVVDVVELLLPSVVVVVVAGVTVVEVVLELNRTNREEVGIDSAFHTLCLEMYCSSMSLMSLRYHRWWCLGLSSTLLLSMAQV